MRPAERPAGAAAMLSIACLALGPVTSSATASQPPLLSVTVLADESSVQPGNAPHGFIGFSQLFSGWCNGAPTFVGFGGLPFQEIEGIYQATSEGLARLVDGSSTAPGSNERFNIFFGATCDESSVVFSARTIEPANGLYRLDGDVVSLLVGEQTTNPSDSMPFSTVGLPRLHAGTVAFWARDQSDQSGIYRVMATGGSPVKVLDQTDALPGQAAGSNVVHHVGGQSDGGVVFYGVSDTAAGVYVTDLEGNVTRIADGATAQPNSSQAFSYFSPGFPVIDGHTVAFAGGSSGPDGVAGVYMAPSDGSGPIITITDTTMALPGGLEDITAGFGSPSIDGQNVAFAGVDAGGFGNAVYLFYEGTLHRIIARGDEIGGRTVDLFDVSVDGLEGGSLVFWTRFTDGTEGILLATIPAPSGAAVLVGLVPFALRRNRRGNHAGLERATHPSRASTSSATCRSAAARRPR